MKLTNIINEEYENLTESEIQIGKTAKNETVQEFMRLYHIWQENIKNMNSSLLFLKMYDEGMQIVYNLSYTLQDITYFCFALKDLKKDTPQKLENIRLGFFISALVNTHYDKTKTTEEYTIITEFFPGYKSHLCYKTNGAKVKIIGDVNNFCGQIMERGNIYIQGNAGVQLGEQISGGTIHLTGNAGMHAAIGLIDGRIIIEGNTGQDLAIHMRNGFVSVGGKIESIGKMIFGGEIYNKERRVYP